MKSHLLRQQHFSNFPFLQCRYSLRMRSPYHIYTVISLLSSSMKSIVAFLLLVVALTSSTSFAFTLPHHHAVTAAAEPQSSLFTVTTVPRTSLLSSGVTTSSPSTTTTSSTALRLKVDPEALKKNAKNKNVSGTGKMAAYGGSVVIALLLPVAFLVWSAVSK